MQKEVNDFGAEKSSNELEEQSKKIFITNITTLEKPVILKRKFEIEEKEDTLVTEALTETNLTFNDSEIKKIRPNKEPVLTKKKILYSNQLKKRFF